MISLTYMDFRTKDNRDANVQIRFEDEMKKTAYLDLEGNQICVGDIICSTDGTYECHYGLYEKDGIEFEGVFFTKDDELFIPPTRAWFGESGLSVSRNKYDKLDEYFKRNFKKYIEDMPTGFIISNTVLRCFAIDYNYRDGLEILKSLLKEVEGIEVKYKVDPRVFPEYVEMSWDKVEDIPKELTVFDGEAYVVSTIDTREFVEEILVKIR